MIGNLQEKFEASVRIVFQIVLLAIHSIKTIVQIHSVQPILAKLHISRNIFKSILELKCT